MSKTRERTIKRYFFDTEFCDPEEEGFGIEFISIGIVAEDEREFYGVHDGFDEAVCLKQAWLKANVLAKLPPRSERESLEDIRRGVLDVIEQCDEVEFWAKNGTYDFFIMNRLFGSYKGLRDALYSAKGIMKVTFRDTNDLRAELDYPETPTLEEKDKHDAIVDARQEKVEYDHLMAIKNGKQPNALSPR